MFTEDNIGKTTSKTREEKEDAIKKNILANKSSSKMIDMLPILVKISEEALIKNCKIY